MRNPALLLAACLALGLTSTASRAAEPWSDPDPPADPRRYAFGDFGFRGGAEYRAQLVYINPISLNTENAREASWLEHRLRLDAAADWHDKIRVVFSTDVLSGVLWGDNGAYGGDPSSLSGTHVGAKDPNVTSNCVALRAGGDPLNPQSYGYTVCPADVFTVRKLYGDVVLPFGLLRVGPPADQRRHRRAGGRRRRARQPLRRGVQRQLRRSRPLRHQAAGGARAPRPPQHLPHRRADPRPRLRPHRHRRSGGRRLRGQPVGHGAAIPGPPLRARPRSARRRLPRLSLGRALRHPHQQPRPARHVPLRRRSSRLRRQRQPRLDARDLRGVPGHQQRSGGRPARPADGRARRRALRPPALHRSTWRATTPPAATIRRRGCRSPSSPSPRTPTWGSCCSSRSSPSRAPAPRPRAWRS